MFTLKVDLSFLQARSRSHAARGNAVKGALRRESWSVYRNVHRTNTGRSAWEQEYQGIPTGTVGTIRRWSVGTIQQELK